MNKFLSVFSPVKETVVANTNLEEEMQRFVSKGFEIILRHYNDQYLRGWWATCKMKTNNGRSELKIDSDLGHSTPQKALEEVRRQLGGMGFTV